jgi:glucose-6-phosphate 1-dehydrogenase
MKSGKNAGPAIIVIFGGTGDLAKRKLIPAFYNLFLDGYMPEKFAIN